MREDESEGADILLVGLVFCIFVCVIMFKNETHLMLILYTQRSEKLDLQVKPGLPYLDIIRLLRDSSPLPVAAYQVLL